MYSIRSLSLFFLVSTALYLGVHNNAVAGLIEMGAGGSCYSSQQKLDISSNAPFQLGAACSVNVTKFDPSLGTLQVVRIWANSGADIRVTAVNTSSETQWGTWSAYGQSNFDLSDPVFQSPLILDWVGGAGGPWLLGGFWCCGVSTSAITMQVVGQFGPDLVLSDLDILGFIGTGNFSVGTSADAVGWTSGLSPEVSLIGNVAYRASVSVKYYFDPLNDAGTAVVPEPSTLALVVICLFGAVAIFRQRKSAVGTRCHS